MQIYKGVSQMASLGSANPALLGSVITIGNFDGVHLGHQQLLEMVIREAQHFKVPSVVYTFDPHPAKVLSSSVQAGKTMVRLFDLRDQQENFAQRGIDLVVIEPFTKEFAQVSAEDFLFQYLSKYLHPKTLVVGHDFTFGARRTGTLNYLENFCAAKGIRLIIIPPYQQRNMVVSSTKIREALTEGNVELAREMLGRNYYLRGHVQHGFRRGQSIGVPTANVHPDVEFIPRKGVYVTQTKVHDRIYHSITNIGVNPTFQGSDGTASQLKIESHLFDFDEQIYDIEVEVQLLHFLRDEKKFNGMDELKTQIKKDINEARRYFNESNPYS